jgi:hypothetical protein
MTESRPAPHTAFTAIPASSNVNTLTFPNEVETRYTSMVAANAPMNAMMGTASDPSGRANALVVPKTNTSDAPSAAPAEVPARPGSTIGFRNIPCIRVPDTPSTAPVNAARNTRGNLS